MDVKIFIYGLALTFCINAVKGEVQCANHGEVCESHNKNSCCKDLECKWLDAAIQYQCRKKEKLGDYCQPTTETINDCSNILHSKCLSGNCVCRHNYINRNNTKCVPLLREFCWNEDCAPNNSLCVDNECQCSNGFSPVGNDRCLPMLLGGACDDDAACRPIKWAQCASNKTCVCSAGTIMTSPVHCSMPLGYSCTSDDECAVTNSGCIDNKCQCKPQYISDSNVGCKRGYLKMPCNSTEYCESYIINTVCVVNRCFCDLNYLPINGNSCQLNSTLEYCNEHIKCIKENSICIDNTCQCKPDYLLRGEKCLPKYLGGSCRVTLDCIDIDLAVCRSNKCVCGGELFPVNRTKCEKPLGKYCSTNEDCIVKYSQCIENKCKCREGYAQISENQCVTKNLRGFCDIDHDCQLIPNTLCSEGQCSCTDNYIEYQTSCAPLLGGSCSIDDQCIIESSICVNNECQCPLEYSQQSSSSCVHKYFDMSCKIDADCVEIIDAKCSDNGKCSCQPNFLRLEPHKCSPLLGSYCQLERDCVAENSECVENKCQCLKRYIQLSDNLCLPAFLGQLCRNDKDCRMISNGICSENNLCICKPNYSQFEDSVCLPLIGERCKENKDCFVDNSNCIDNECKCLNNYMPLSNTECVSKYLSTICYSDSDCGLTMNSHCSSNNRCVCNQNFITTEDDICGPTLGGSCSDNSRCVISNSNCVDRKCQCKQNFIRGRYNNCLTTRLKEFCQSNEDCIEIKNAKCIGNKCDCWNNHTTVDNSACKPLLNDFCRTNDDCIVENSVCIKFKCQCSPQYSPQLPDKCSPVTLGKSCETDVDCRLIKNGICSKDKICICPGNTFSLNERTCSLRLETFCHSGECDIESSECFNNKCQCKPDYSPISPVQCVKTRSLYYCKDVTECADNWHFQCLTNKCVCKHNAIAINNSTCLSILEGPCWRDDQCIVGNSRCIDYHCKCKPNFLTVANNLCVKK